MRKRLWVSVVGTAILIAIVLSLFLPTGVGVSANGTLSIGVAYAQSHSPNSNQVASVGSSVEELEESVWMRTKNSKVFHSYGIPNRDYHDIYLDAVHYEVGHEREIETLTGTETITWETWEDIDNTLEPAGELSPWDWQMVRADYNVYMFEDFTYGQILKFEKADPHGTVLGDVAFQPMALQWTNNLDQIQEVSMPQSGIPSVVDNRIEWEDAYGSGIDFSWICSSTRLLKLLTVSSLNDLPAPALYILDGGYPVLELNLILDPTKDLDIFVDGSQWSGKGEVLSWFSIIEFKLGNETLWGFMPLRVWDSSGTNETAVLQKLEKTGNKLHVSTRVPYEWIQSATFPIYIDAVVDEWVEASSDDASELIADGSMDLTNTIIDFGSYAGATHAGFRFVGVDTTDVEDVGVAYLEFYPAESDSRAVSYTWYGEDVASTATFTSTAYNISDRTRTDAGVAESPPADWISGTWVQTSDLSDILNEVFNGDNWISGDNLAILNIYNSGNGERRSRSWDYNDHTKAPKLHFENPTAVTYYYDSYSVSFPWNNDPAYMVDGILTNYASTAEDGDDEYLTGNTCPGIELGTILKVEVRAYGYGDGNDQVLFGNYPITMPGSAGWSAYVDITRSIVPLTFAEVAAENAHAEKNSVGKGNMLFCSKVEIRVTWWTAPDLDVGIYPQDWITSGPSGYTFVDKNNPANVSGTLHTVNVYAATNITGLRVGTFYLTNGYTLKCRDSVLVGDVVAGAVRTFPGLSIAVEAGDYIGCYFSAGEIEWHTATFAGVWDVLGEYIDPGDETTFTFTVEDVVGLYGYGDIGEPDISVSPISYDFGVVSESSTPSTSTTYFTVTNNSSMQTDQTISVTTNTWSGGVTWTHSDTATPDVDTAGLKANKGGTWGVGDVIVKYSSPNYIAENQPASTNYDFGLKLIAPTSHTDGIQKQIIVRIAAVAG